MKRSARDLDTEVLLWGRYSQSEIRARLKPLNTEVIQIDLEWSGDLGHAPEAPVKDFSPVALPDHMRVGVRFYWASGDLLAAIKRLVTLYRGMARFGQAYWWFSVHTTGDLVIIDRNARVITIDTPEWQTQEESMRYVERIKNSGLAEPGGTYRDPQAPKLVVRLTEEAGSDDNRANSLIALARLCYPTP